MLEEHLLEVTRTASEACFWFCVPYRHRLDWAYCEIEAALGPTRMSLRAARFLAAHVSPNSATKREGRIIGL